MYRKGAPDPIGLAIADAAKRRDFYSGPRQGHERTLDDRITEYEGSLAEKVVQLRQLSIGSRPDSSTVAEVVSHLSFRSAHIRDTLADLATGFFESVPGEDFEVDRLVGLDTHIVSASLRESLLTSIRSTGLVELTGFREETLLALGYFLLREQRASFIPGMRSQLQNTLMPLLSELPQMAASGHRRALEGNIISEDRKMHLEGLSWRIERAPPEGLVLPDCISLGLTEAGGWVPYQTGSTAKIWTVVTPLSTGKLLIGQRLGDSDYVEIARINEIAAAASNEFFLCHREGEDYIELSKLIGGGPKRIVESLTDKEELLLATRDREALPVESKSGERIGSETFQYQVSFTNQVSATLLEETAAAVKAITTEFSRERRIDLMSAFVFARHQDIGEERAGWVDAIGTISSRLDENKLTWQAIADISLAEKLVSADDETRAKAIRSVWELLGRGAHQQLVFDRFTDVVVNTYPDHYEGLLFGISGDALGIYFAARHAAGLFGQELEGAERFEIEFVDSQTMIQKALEDYESHKNVEKLFSEASNLVAGVMFLVSRVLGYADAGGIPGEELQLLSDALVEGELSGWLNLYHSDLERYWALAGEWPEFEELLMSNRHFERLLWSIGLVPERREGGAIYVHVRT